MAEIYGKIGINFRRFSVFTTLVVFGQQTLPECRLIRLKFQMYKLTVENYIEDVHRRRSSVN